jgi:hypothetical protein
MAGSTLAAPDLTAYYEAPQEPPRARVKWLTWEDLAECDAHPLSVEFRRYLKWKRDFPQRPPN